MFEKIKPPKTIYNEANPPKIVNGKLKKIEEEIKTHKDAIKALEQEKIVKSSITCPGCNKKKCVSDWFYVPVNFYVEPYSCTGGDYWYRADSFYLKCPSCKSYLRAYHPDSSYKEWARYMKCEEEIYNR